VGDDEVTGVALPSHDPNTICRQCHDPSGLSRGVAALDWPTSVWPALAPRVPGRPPPIPHDFQLRENCVACHAGPGAVAEIRTAHPDRASCRQCHLGQETGSSEFSRPAPGPTGSAK
jgi:cytochrome c-type protein NapB